MDELDVKCVHNRYYCICQIKYIKCVFSTKYLDIYKSYKSYKNFFSYFTVYKVLFKIPQYLNPLNSNYFIANNLTLLIEPLYLYTKLPTDIILLIGDYLLITEKYFNENKVKSLSLKNIENKQLLIKNNYYNQNPKNKLKQQINKMNYSCNYKNLKINKIVNKNKKNLLKKGKKLNKRIRYNKISLENIYLQNEYEYVEII